MTPPDWTFSNVAFAAVCTFVNAVIWRRTARWLLSRPYGPGKTRTVEAITACPESVEGSFAAQQTEKNRRKPADPLRTAHTDALRLVGLAWNGFPLTRRQAKEHPQWTTYAWRQALRFARKAGVLDRQQNVLVDSYEEAQALLHEEWSRQGDLRRQGRWVSA